MDPSLILANPSLGKNSPAHPVIENCLAVCEAQLNYLRSRDTARETARKNADQRLGLQLTTRMGGAIPDGEYEMWQSVRRLNSFRHHIDFILPGDARDISRSVNNPSIPDFERTILEMMPLSPEKADEHWRGGVEQTRQNLTPLIEAARSAAEKEHAETARKDRNMKVCGSILFFVVLPIMMPGVFPGIRFLWMMLIGVFAEVLGGILR